MAAGQIIVPGAMPTRDRNGRATIGKLFFYEDETQTPAPVYTSSALTTQLANPVVSDAAGRFPSIWADDAELFTVVWTYDDEETIKTYSGVSAAEDAVLASVALAEAAADEAEASADQAAADLAAILAIEAAGSDAPAIAGKLDRDGSNALAGLFTVIGDELVDNGTIPTYALVADAEGATIKAATKTIETFGFNTEGVGGAKYTRASLADIVSAGYPASSYFRSTDRFMPDGSTDATNGGYWLIAEPQITPEMVGALRTGTRVGGGADDTAEIQDAIYTAEAASKPVRFLSGQGDPTNGTAYRITGPLVATGAVDILFDPGARIYDTGGGAYVALTIGSAATFRQYRTYGGEGGIDIFLSPATDWSSEDSVTVRIIRAIDCDIHLNRTRGHTVGAQFVGDGGGFAYNRLLLGHHFDHKVQLDFVNKNAGGYTNQVEVYGGRISATSGVNNSLDRIGVRIRSERTDNAQTPDGRYYNDQLTFIGTAFEMLGTVATGRAIAIQLDHARDLRFIAIRDEGNDVCAIVNNLSNHITISCDFSDSGALTNDQPVVEINGAYDSVIVEGRQKSRQMTGSAWASKPGWWAHDYTTSQVSMIDCAIANSTNTTNDLGNGGITLNAAYLELPSTRGLARRIAVKAGMGVTVRRQTAASYPGRLLCRVYDTSGTVLTGATTNRANSTAYSLADKRLIPNVPNMYLECTTAGTSGASVPAWTYNAGDTITDGTAVWTIRKNHVRGDQGYFSSMSSAWTSAYGNTSDSSQDQTLWFAQDGYADIIVSGGTASCRLTGGFTVEALDGYALNSWHPMSYEDGKRFALQIPTNGTWRRGDILWNATPSTGGPLGWICTTAGTPGTWVPFGMIRNASTYAASNVTTDRTFDADTVAVAELADVVGTLIADLRAGGLLT